MVDSSGLPTARLSYRLHPNDDRLIRYGMERALEIAKAADAFDIKVNDFREADGQYRPPTWHLLGTARMGDDPETSVTNLWHQSWDVPNLYIIDGSSMPTCAGVNPTSTISAMALRAAGRIARNFRYLAEATRPILDPLRGVGQQRS
jgi:choline dehydrogenase-like flavoprotein